MLRLSSLAHRLVITPLVLLCSAPAFACDSVSAGQTLWVRLTAPVTTFTAKPGDDLSAVLTESLECNGDIVLPVGTEITGVVKSVRKVGWGIRHETAALRVDFNRALPVDRPAVPLSTTVLEIENAREQVSK